MHTCIVTTWTKKGGNGWENGVRMKDDSNLRNGDSSFPPLVSATLRLLFLCSRCAVPRFCPFVVPILPFFFYLFCCCYSNKKKNSALRESNENISLVSERKIRERVLSECGEEFFLRAQTVSFSLAPFGIFCYHDQEEEDKRMSEKGKVRIKSDRKWCRERVVMQFIRFLI